MSSTIELPIIYRGGIMPSLINYCNQTSDSSFLLLIWRENDTLREREIREIAETFDG